MRSHGAAVTRHNDLGNFKALGLQIRIMRSPERGDGVPRPPCKRREVRRLNNADRAPIPQDRWCGRPDCRCRCLCGRAARALFAGFGDAHAIGRPAVVGLLDHPFDIVRFHKRPKLRTRTSARRIDPPFETSALSTLADQFQQSWHRRCQSPTCRGGWSSGHLRWCRSHPFAVVCRKIPAEQCLAGGIAGLVPAASRHVGVHAFHGRSLASG
jgi:hypothetical protein